MKLWWCLIYQTQRYCTCDNTWGSDEITTPISMGSNVASVTIAKFQNASVTSIWNLWLSHNYSKLCMYVDKDFRVVEFSMFITTNKHPHTVSNKLTVAISGRDRPLPVSTVHPHFLWMLPSKSLRRLTFCAKCTAATLLFRCVIQILLFERVCPLISVYIHMGAISCVGENTVSIT